MQTYYYVNDPSWGNEACIVSESVVKEYLTKWWYDYTGVLEQEEWEAMARKPLQPLMSITVGNPLNHETIGLI